ncbi:MAG: response regulator, partial [Rhodoferax sp.]|nr:response regulator [Rhodoferax sp.]
MKIQKRLLLLTMSVTLIVATLTLLVSGYLMRDALESHAKDTLVAVLEGRHSALVRRFGAIESELHVLSVSGSTYSRLSDLDNAFAKLGKNAQTVLQQNYLTAAGDSDSTAQQAKMSTTPYGEANRSAMAHFQHHSRAYGWVDILLIDAQGNVVFSLLKNPDFAINLNSGASKDSGLARAVLPILQHATPGSLGFADFSPYGPNHNEVVSFLARPVFDPVRQVFLGAIAIQIKNDQLERIMHDQTGLGESGEVFMIGKDGWLLTNSRFSNGPTAFMQQIDTESSRMVLAKKTAVKLTPDYRGVESIVSVKPYEPFPNALGDKATWGVIAKITQDEVLADYFRLRQVLLIAGGSLALLSLLLGYFGARSITRPLLGIRDSLVGLARGDIVAIQSLDRTDEIGEIAKAADSFRLMAQQVQHDHWLTGNVTVLTNAASMSASVMVAANSVLDKICEQLAVPVGAIYLREEDHFQRIGSRGLVRRSQVENTFDLENGLLGQCARDGQPIVLSPIPVGLSIISTGLVEFPPQELVLYPIRHKTEVLAVLELAAIKSLEPVQHEFLKAACQALGLHFANLAVSEHNLKLLGETRKQADELHTSAQYARSLLEASLDPLVTISTEGKITDVNSATETVTGIARSNLIGSDFADYFTDKEKAREGYREAFAKGFVTDFPLAIHHAAGKITDVLYNASIYRDGDGKVLGVFAAARDITERKKAEHKLKEQQEALLRSNEEMKALNEEMRSQSEEMKAQNEELRASQEELRAQQEDSKHKNDLLEAQSQQLEAAIEEARTKASDLQLANQYKSEFLANMSHELRTPLNSVLILSKSLAENEEKNLSADQVESAAVISESGAQLLTLINDILDLSKIEAGKMEIHHEVFPLSEMTTYLSRVFSPQADKKQIRLYIYVDPLTPATLATDRQRLTQVLTNLLSNAIKFTDAGGTVGLRVSTASDGLQLEVIDNGIGIAQAKQEHIFGAFQQVDGSTSRKYGGSGLGLAISRHLVRLLGGDISVDSAPGKGSRFIVRLPHQAYQANASTTLDATGSATPVDTASSLDPTPVAASLATSMTKHILIVEDDPRLPLILKKMVNGLGLKAVCVESAELAMASISRESPAGILLDLGLPKMSGMELLQRLREDAANAQIPVFIMSGASDTGEAKTLGAMGFLRKPITREKIATAIRMMVEAEPAVEKKRVLVADANPENIRLIRDLFIHDSLALVVAETGEAALQHLHKQPLDAVILGLNLPDFSGKAWIKKAYTSLNPP